MNVIELKNSKLKYNKIIYPDINIIFEISRGKLYCLLLKSFIRQCRLLLPESIFTHKKSIYRTLTNLYSTWFFSLYSTYDFKGDTFFPSNCDNNNILREILLDYCSLDNTIENKDYIIDKILTNNRNMYYSILEKNNKYINSDFIINNKNNFTISKILKEEIRDDKVIKFYKFNIVFNFNFYFNNYRLDNILNNIIIPVSTYNKMKNKYSGFPDELDKFIFIIIFRYQLLGSNNHQLGVLPNVLEKIKSDFDIEIECFASGINAETGIFCSIYYDIEKYFGSVGSFFNIELVKGIYTFNPPYQKDIITNSILRILQFLETGEKLGFIITIPIWDNEGKKKMKEKDMENNNDKINYEDFKIMDTIKKSKYFYGLRMISKNDFTYLDHNFYLHKNKTIQNTYVIILANFENTFIDKINDYNFNDILQ